MDARTLTQWLLPGPPLDNTRRATRAAGVQLFHLDCVIAVNSPPPLKEGGCGVNLLSG